MTQNLKQKILYIDSKKNLKIPLSLILSSEKNLMKNNNQKIATL